MSKVLSEETAEAGYSASASTVRLATATLERHSRERFDVADLSATTTFGPATDVPARVPLTEETLKHAVPYVPTSVVYACVKRLIDLVGASIGLLLTSPLMLICAIWIKLYDGGPILFWQPRVGERGEVFQIVKFRSMIVDAEKLKAAMMELNEHADDRTFKIFNDPRITRVGRFMRRLSLDELPQFWNVLCGQMSLVGPRPALMKEVLLYDESDLYRLAVKPGLTCIWQVSGRSRLDFSQQVELDKSYIDSRSIWNDCRLILKTIPAVFCGDGAA